MPHADFSEQNDPWDSFARELGAENEPLDEIAEAPTEEPAEDVGQEGFGGIYGLPRIVGDRGRNEAGHTPFSRLRY